MRGTARPLGLEWIADRVDSASTRGAKEGAQNCWKDVRMFVRINVSQGNASLLKEVDLRSCFGLDFGCSNAAREKARQKRAERGRKAACARIDQRGNLIRRKHGLTVHQHNMATNSKRRS